MIEWMFIGFLVAAIVVVRAFIECDEQNSRF
jgi:hypothetical protein